jgi:MoaF C-terminal domain
MSIRMCTGIALLITVISCQQKSSENPNVNSITPKDLVGKTIEYQYGESVYHVTLDTDTTMHWEAMAGDEKGALENETYVLESIDDRKLFITWGEANGIGVAQVLDFEKGIVYNHLLRGRNASVGRGVIKILR